MNDLSTKLPQRNVSSRGPIKPAAAIQLAMSPQAERQRCSRAGPTGVNHDPSKAIAASWGLCNSKTWLPRYAAAVRLRLISQVLSKAACALNTRIVAARGGLTPCVRIIRSSSYLRIKLSHVSREEKSGERWSITLPELFGIQELEVEHEQDAARSHSRQFRLRTDCVYRAVLLHLKDTCRLALQQDEGLPSIENDDDVAARKLMAAGAPGARR